MTKDLEARRFLLGYFGSPTLLHIQSHHALRRSYHGTDPSPRNFLKWCSNQLNIASLRIKDKNDYTNAIQNRFFDITSELKEKMIVTDNSLCLVNKKKKEKKTIRQFKGILMEHIIT